jgi:hypothetical protein
MEDYRRWLEGNTVYAVSGVNNGYLHALRWLSGPGSIELIYLNLESGL